MSQLEVSEGATPSRTLTLLGDANTAPILVDGRTIGPDHVFSFGKRLTKAQRALVIKCLVARDGTRCQICRQTLQPEKADIDHVDGRSFSHVARNLRLACHPCNASRWAQQRLNNRFNASPSASSAILERDSTRQGEGASVGTESEILRLARRNEAAFRAFWFEKALQAGDPFKGGKVLNPDSLRVQAREWVGCSKTSSYSYMERLIAENGPFVVGEDSLAGTHYLVFHDKRCYAMTVQEIEALYPARGLLSKAEQ